MSEGSESNLMQENSHSLDAEIPQMLHRRNHNEFFRPLCNWPFRLCIIKGCVVSSIVLLTSQGRFQLPETSSDKSNNFQFKEQCLQKEIYRLQRHELPPRVLNENRFRHFTDITAIMKSSKFCGSKFINIGNVLFSELNELCGADESSKLYCHETLDEILLHSVSSNSSPSKYEQVVETSQTVGDGATSENSLLAEADCLESLVNPGGIKEMCQVGDATAKDNDSTLICLSGDIPESNAESTISASATSSCECSSSVSSQTATSDEVARARTIEFCPKQKVDFLVGKRKCKANMRERKRIRDLSVAFTDLKKSIPKFKYHCKQISQLEILREAVNYIRQLLALLDGNKPVIPANGGFTGSVRARLFRYLANSKVISSEPVVHVKDDYSATLNNTGTDELLSDSLVPMETEEQLTLPMNVSSEDDVGSGSSPVSPASFDCSNIGLDDDLRIWYPADSFFLTDGITDEVPASDCDY